MDKFIIIPPEPAHSEVTRSGMTRIGAIIVVSKACNISLAWAKAILDANLVAGQPIEWSSVGKIIREIYVRVYESE